MDLIAQIEVATKEAWADLTEKEEKWQQVNKKKKGSKSSKLAARLSLPEGLL